MASEGHAPTDTNSPAYRLSKLGEGKCPDCRVSLDNGVCPRCSSDYGGVV
jgi:hypothetical protein